MPMDLISIRRQLHTMAELSFEETRTASYIEETLREWGIPSRRVTPTGVVADIGFDDGPLLLLRADMDALPIEEKTNLPFAASQGVMHACGHDVHMACLLGAAYLLQKEQWKEGRVRLVFQPGEETTGGAQPMIEEGVLEDVEAALALHVEPAIKTGQIALRKGAMYASPDEFSVVWKGKGGHGAYPAECVNPLLAAANLTKRLQELNEQTADDSVLSVCAILGGTCPNVIPDEATVLGTVRSLSEEQRQWWEEQIGKLVKEVEEQEGMQAEYAFRYLYPPVINDPDMTEFVVRTARDVLGESNVLEKLQAGMYGEDFSYFTQTVPGAIFHLGCWDGREETAYPLHSPRFCPDEACLDIGASLLAQLVRDYFS